MFKKILDSLDEKYDVLFIAIKKLEDDRGSWKEDKDIFTYEVPGSPTIVIKMEFVFCQITYAEKTYIFGPLFAFLFYPQVSNLLYPYRGEVLPYNVQRRRSGEII